MAALVHEHFDDAVASAPTQRVALGVGAAMSQGATSWVLVEDRPDRGLGVALTWALRQNAEHLHVLVPDRAGELARRASEFDLDITVWSTAQSGTTLARATPEPFVEQAEVDGRHLAFADVILDSGAEVVVEHGVVCGEVRGLEVCRVVTDPMSGDCRLEVGVGAHDREAFGLLHGDAPTAESLRRIVDVVASHRRDGADPHPLNRLGAERALRARLIAEPSLVDASFLRWAAPATPRPNLKDPVPCVAVGDSRSGQPVVVVCSTGVDIDVVPFAGEARLFHGAPDTELVIAVPERDATSLTRQLAGTLRHPARVVGLASGVA
ncbi:MAG: hypothetical protein ACKO84_01525 [Actinomycetota bacterium]